MKNSFGICEWSLPGKGLEAVELAAKIGFDGVQLGDLGGTAAGFPLATDRALQERYRSVLAEGRILFPSLHLYTLLREGTMNCPRNTSEGESAMRSIRAGIEACRAIGIPVLMLTGGADGAALANFAEMLRFACDAGDENGVNIAFESLYSVEDILRIREITGGRARACYDTYNMLRFHRGDPREDIERLTAADIDHYHLKDAPGNNEGCVPLGEGCGHFAEVASIIRASGFSGWFITENYYAKPPMTELGAAEELARRDLQTMRESFPG